MDENNLVITRRRKKYKFAKFNEMPNCFQLEEWIKDRAVVIEQLKSKLILEIGAGSALFLVELAKLHPDNFYIAIDIKSDRLYRGAKKAACEKVNNIVFIRSYIWHITEIVPKNSVDEIWLTFSDPYPRKSDAKHRLTSLRFQEMYKTVLRHNAESLIHFKTDSQLLFNWSLEQFSSNNWNTQSVSRNLHESNMAEEYKIMTTYERKFVEKGLPIYYAEFLVV